MPVPPSTRAPAIAKRAKWLVPMCIALVLAIFLWPKPGPYESDLFVPLDIAGLAEGLTLHEMPVKGLEIRIRGPEKLVRNLMGQTLSYRLDLSGMNTGVHAVPIRPERFGLSREIGILHTHPDPLIFRIEPEITKEVPVQVAIQGTPASGFYVADIRPYPASVVLRGAESSLDPVKVVVTKPIDVSGLHESFKKEVALDLLEGVVPVAPGGVIVAELTLGERETRRTFSGVPVTGKNARYRFAVTPPSIDITVNGPVRAVTKLENEGIEAYVDLQGLTPGVYPRRAVIVLPVEATLVQAEPEIFTVTIQPRALPRADVPVNPSE